MEAFLFPFAHSKLSPPPTPKKKKTHQLLGRRRRLRRPGGHRHRRPQVARRLGHPRGLQVLRLVLVRGRRRGGGGQGGPQRQGRSRQQPQPVAVALEREARRRRLARARERLERPLRLERRENHTPPFFFSCFALFVFCFHAPLVSQKIVVLQKKKNKSFSSTVFSIFRRKKKLAAKFQFSFFPSENQCESLEASPCLAGHCATTVPFLEAAAGQEAQEQRSLRREKQCWHHRRRRRHCRRRPRRQRKNAAPAAFAAPSPPRPPSRRRPPRPSPGPSSGTSGTCTIPWARARGSGSTQTPFVRTCR